MVAAVGALHPFIPRGSSGLTGATPGQAPTISSSKERLSNSGKRSRSADLIAITIRDSISFQRRPLPTLRYEAVKAYYQRLIVERDRKWRAFLSTELEHMPKEILT